MNQILKNSTQRSVKILFSIVILSILKISFCSKTFCQVTHQLSVYPFTNGSRSDSIKIINKRVKALIAARRFYEKAFLKQKAVFLPLLDCDTDKLDNQKFILYDDLLKVATDKKYYRLSYKHAHKALKIIIDSENKKNYERYKVEKRNEQPTAQQRLTQIHEDRQYTFIFLSLSYFDTLNSTDPRYSVIKSEISDFINQVVFGYPYNIDGYVNSVNYTDFNTNNFETPDIIKQIIQQTFSLAKQIVNSRTFQQRLSQSTLSLKNISNSNKLWINTDTTSSIVYLSPYLIRAVFNMSYYSNDFSSLPEERAGKKTGVLHFFSGKHEMSAIQIDDRYFQRFIDSFSTNLFFVISHELSHIYLTNFSSTSDVEMACDTYAAYFCISYFKTLNLGVFQSLVIKSIESDELNFWGFGIDSKSLENRFDNLKIIQKTLNINNAKPSIQLPKN
jgi:hypothetical protein